MTESDTRRWQWLALAVALGALLWLLAPVLTPFVVSALLAWMGDPLVGRLERTGRSREVAVMLVFTLMALILILAMLVLLPLLEEQLTQLLDWLPNLASWITVTAVPWIEQRFHVQIRNYVDPQMLVALLNGHWQQAGGIVATVLASVSKSGLTILHWITYIALIPVLTYYFLRDWRSMLTSLRELLPRPLEPAVLRLAEESDEVLGGFLRGQLSVMISLGAIYAAGLTLVGIQFGFLIGFIAGLVSFVPYLGAIVGVSAALIAALVQYGDVTHLALVLAVFGVGLTCESFLLVPWLVGDRIGLHPVAVIFSVMAGGELFGFLGVLLALPTAAVAMVGLRYAHQRYTESHLYGAPESDEPQPWTEVPLANEPESLELLPLPPEPPAAPEPTSPVA
jgi:predicted PurR-regulated permease PerM